MTTSIVPAVSDSDNSFVGNLRECSNLLTTFTWPTGQHFAFIERGKEDKSYGIKAGYCLLAKPEPIENIIPNTISRWVIRENDKFLDANVRLYPATDISPAQFMVMKFRPGSWSKTNNPAYAISPDQLVGKIYGFLSQEFIDNSNNGVVDVPVLLGPTEGSFVIRASSANHVNFDTYFKDIILVREEPLTEIKPNDILGRVIRVKNRIIEAAIWNRSNQSLPKRLTVIPFDNDKPSYTISPNQVLGRVVGAGNV